jgi:hypothetical protein
MNNHVEMRRVGRRLEIEVAESRRRGREITKLAIKIGQMEHDLMVLRAENECLRKELARLRGLPRLGALEAENERMRAALEKVAGAPMVDGQDIAREALRVGDDDEKKGA